MAGLQQRVDGVTENIQRCGLYINIDRTSNQKRVKHIIKYSYLRTTVTDQWDHSYEVKIRIEKPEQHLTINPIFKSHNVSAAIKM